MTLKVTRIEEGPMDFMRGASGAAGRKVMQSRPVQAIKKGVGDVVQAGRQASAVGDLAKQVQQLAQVLAQYDKLKAMAGASNAQDPSAKPEPQQSAAPAAFRTDAKPKGKMGQHGFEYTFNSFITDLANSEEQLNEGVMDFLKGAGQAAASKASEKLQSYVGGKGDWLRNAVQGGKDIMQAGREASDTANVEKAAGKLEAVKQQGQVLLKAVVAAVRQMGPTGRNALAQALKNVPPEQQHRVMKLVMSNVK